MARDLRIGARGPTVRFTFEGVAHDGAEGETLAAALRAVGVLTLRHNPVDGTPRGMFCAMGVCQDCVVLIDDRPIEACRVRLREGLSATMLR